MTPREWAEKAYRHWDLSSAGPEEEIAAVEEMFRQAVADEREACARQIHGHSSYYVAAFIRARDAVQ